RGRAPRLAGADALHDARRLSLHGAARALLAAGAHQDAGGGAAAVNVSEPFIRRPVATSLLAAAVLVSGVGAYSLLPVAPLPRVDFPTINVSAGLPGASPETIAQVPGVGQVFVGGGQQPAVRVQVDPVALAGLGLSLEDVRNALTQASIDQPKGSINGTQQAIVLAANDQLFDAAQYKNIPIAVK